ncbi:MAG: Fis family transcriptional regulator [Eubacterium sp.]|nr:Fis family transcriptional regulator [Eubacterium sp.]
MKGSHHIILETKHLKYEFDIKRNITIILGDSATGKTTMMGLLRERGLRGESSGVKLQSDVPCEVYAGNEDQWQMLLNSYRQSILFFDEGYSFIYKKEFASAIADTDNYYVFITRKPIKCLPYSINEIYGIRTTGKYHFPEQIYHEFYPVYTEDDDIPSRII